MDRSERRSNHHLVHEQRAGLGEGAVVEEGPDSARRLLGVFAHPDDEVFCAGGTMALAAEAGAEVMTVSATRAEHLVVWMGKDAKQASR